MITRAEEIAWKEHPVTKEFFLKLQELKDLYVHKWTLARMVNSPQTQPDLWKEACRDAGVVEALEIIINSELSESEDKETEGPY